MVAQRIVQQVGDGAGQQSRGQVQLPAFGALQVGVHRGVQLGRGLLPLGGLSVRAFQGLVGRLAQCGHDVRAAGATGRRSGTAGVFQLGQLQQLFQRGVHVLDARVRLRQGLPGLCAIGRSLAFEHQLGDLCVGLDGGQRRAQFVGRIGGPAAFVFQGRIHARQQLVQIVGQWCQLHRVQPDLNGAGVLRWALCQHLSQLSQGLQAPACDPPAQHYHAHQRQHKGEHQRAGECGHQLIAYIQPVGGGDADAVVLEHVGAPQLAAFFDLAKTAGGRAETGTVVGARQRHDVDLAAHQADFAGHAVAADDGLQGGVLGAQRRVLLLELVCQTGDHLG